MLQLHYMRNAFASSHLLSSPQVRMILAGWLSVAVSYSVFILLIQFGVHYQIASIANFCTYLVVNFFLNRMWAFRSNGSVRYEAIAHTLLHTANQILIMIGLYLLVEHMHLHVILAQAILQVLATITVFIATPIIFKRKE